MILVVLISGCAVEIENNIEAALSAFGNDPVETAEIPFAVFVKDFCALVIIVEVAKPERNAHAVEAELNYLVEVVFGYPVVLVDVDELICFLNTETLGEGVEGRNIVVGVRDGGHPCLVDEPCAEVHSAKNNFFAALVVDFFAFRVQHVLVGYRAAFFGGLFAVVGVYRQTHRAYHEHQAQQCAEHS